MRNWKNWLFPILTLLTVAALALLPLRLSTLRDGELTGTVHTEELSADSNFPFKPPDLPGRIWLLVQFQEMPDRLTIMEQELEGAERDREIQRLREAMADLGTLLHPETAALLNEIDGDSWDWERYYLRDQADLSSASFTMVSTYDKQLRATLSVTLDGESGQVLSFHLRGKMFDYEYLDGESASQELGRAVLDRLGLTYELVESGSDGNWVTFRLPECRSWFTVRVLSSMAHELSFGFHLDWETIDREIAESYGFATDVSGRDARSMQKW